MFALLYAAAGRCADVVMVNSKWTKVPCAATGSRRWARWLFMMCAQSHIDYIWGRGARAVVVYPPCNTESLQVRCAAPVARVMYADAGAAITSAAAAA